MSGGEGHGDGQGEEAVTGAGEGLRVAVDIGGTFTDFVLFSPGSGTYRTFKVLSTPDDPSRAVLEGLEEAGATAPALLVHGSTVATNAVLERKGARTALVATRGFGDLLSIARQDRTDLYDFGADRPEPLVRAADCYELGERVNPDGRVLEPLDDGELESLADHLVESGVESAAVCFLFSFLRPEHEERVASRMEEEGLFVSRSSEVLPEFREYGRASTTAMNAYVSPLMDRYLERLGSDLSPDVFRIMQSNGGSARSEAARRHGVRSVLSGPAGGAVGALRLARSAGWDRALSFDMGGTSTDVALLDGEVGVTTEGSVAGLPVGVPLVDLHTVGAGGGSVARVDSGGALRVGPESSGADPGPVCYGRGGERPTVSDANLLLGRLPPDEFLGGELELAADAAAEAMDRLAEEAGLEAAGSPSAAERAALGVVRVANAHMERALRVMSVERGHDPADFALVSFGGAGGLHACELARRLGMGEVLVPDAAAVLSAFGMLSADVVKDYVRTVMLPGTTPADDLLETARPLVRRGERALAEEGVPEERREVTRSLDLRYEGQSYELEVPLADGYLERFHRVHEEAYGYADRGEEVQVVNLRVRAVGGVERPPLPEEGPAGGSDPSEAGLGRRRVVLGDGTAEEVPLYRGGRLRPGHRLEGPCVVVKEDTTVFLDRGDRGEMDRHRSLRLEVAGR